ncbi:MAG: sel1 repeat family protein, partial [Butyrivibrio sp.]|nr:sel1 repeat family protein [Butyrivibrio sp.]
AGGHAEAMLMIGHLYEKGKGVLQDYNSAMEWYRKAAENGDATAMNNIGSMYHEGRGVAKDYTCARNWYQKAISAGDVDGVSKKNLEILEEEIRRYAQTPSRQQSSGCFITTATCDNFGKPDNCYELNAFRLFRDNWLSSQPDGPELISEYHDVAPVIVEKINSLSNAKDIYADIWDKYLSKCLKFIEQGNNFQCKEIYVDMVRALQCRFL